MIFAQTPLVNWPEMLNHSVALAVLAFIGTLIMMYYKRTYGVDGTDTKESASRVENNAKNSETLAASQVTLVELKDLAARQQQLCGIHSTGIVQITTELTAVEDKLDITVDATEAMANQWGDKNHKEYRTEPVINSILHAIDTVEKLTAKCDSDYSEDLRLLRAKIQDEKTQMQRG